MNEIDRSITGVDQSISQSINQSINQSITITITITITPVRLIAHTREATSEHGLGLTCDKTDTARYMTESFAQQSPWELTPPGDVLRPNSRVW
jgi:hypothetical protein